MKEKLLTLVIPTYNMEKYLEKCLDSLLVSDNEMLKTLEVLIVIDGAKDGSSAIGHRYQDLYPDTFRVIDKENGNYGSCINRGLKEATGTFIKILDADDWFDTKNFELFLNFLSTSRADLVLSDFDFVKPSGEIITTYRYSQQPEQHTVRNNKAFKNIWMHAVTYRRAIFNDLNYHQTEGISHTDIEWIFLPMVRVKRVDSFPHVVYKYLLGRDGQTMDPKVFQREYSHEIQGFKANLTAWNVSATIGRGDAEEYLWYRLIVRASYIYQCNILGCFKGFSLRDLEDFDSYVKTCNNKLYDELETITLCNRRFHFIHYWRKWHSRPLILIILKIEQFAYYVWGKIKSVIVKG